MNSDLRRTKITYNEGNTTLSIMTLGIMTLGIMTLGIMTLGIMTLGIMTLSIYPEYIAYFRHLG
jgi:hypothetical protein